MWLRSSGHYALIFLLCCSLAAGQMTVNCIAGDCDCCICLDIGTSLRTCSVSESQNFSSRGVIGVLPGAFEHADHVVHLDLSYNTPIPAPAPMVLYSESFMGLTNLQTLDLRSNQLHSLPDGVFGPVDLSRLELSLNNLSSLTPGILSGLSNLTTLLLDNNQLASIPPGLFDSLPALISITLELNPWDCTSNDTIVLYELVMSGVVSDGNQVRCTSGGLVVDLELAPMVVQHPQSQFDLRPGDTAVFTVEATGTALTYSWSHNAAGLQDGGRIAGANTPTLTISDVQESDAGTYHCLISNPVGSIQSNSAMLSLRQTPQFSESVYRASVDETYVEGGFERPQDGFVQVLCRLEPGGTVFSGTYMITETNVGPFSLDLNTGALSVTVDLDFETQTFYSFTVSCNSTSDPTLSDAAAVEITIESVNEFLPDITSGPVILVLFTETTEVGSIIVSRRSGEGIRQYSVSDEDDGPHGNLTFTFSENNPTDEMHFNLNFITGDLTLRERIDVDSVGGGLVNFGLIITVCDSFPPRPDCPNLQLNFLVSAGNDNIPRFSQSSYSIQTPESTELNTTFFVVECTDADVGVGVVEGIEFQNVTDPQMWTLNTDGALKLNRQLDFETTQRYEFTLRCYDTDGLQDIVPVTVNVLPVNDIPPVFNIAEYSFTASRLSPLGDERVGQVTATDADQVVGNSITYSIQGDGNFAINPDDGVITVSDYIFNFEGSSFELTVIASDGMFQATASVEITIEGPLSIAEVIIIAISGIVLLVIICICGCCCCYHFFPKSQEWDTPEWHTQMEMKECKAYGVNRSNTDKRSSATQQREESKIPASGNENTLYTNMGALKFDITYGDEEEYEDISDSVVTGGNTGEDEEHTYEVIPTSGDPEEHEYEPATVTGGAQEVTCA